MLHDTGMAEIYRVERDEQAPPPGPAPTLTKVAEQPFGELTVGVTRFYSAAAASMRVDRYIEIWRDDSITTRHLCRLPAPAGARWYNIQKVDPTEDKDGILVTRLTLEEIDGSAWEGTVYGENQRE